MPSKSRANHKNSTDKELIDHYQSNGDLEILGILYNRYISLVYGVALKYLRNREESQDVVMHLFEKLIHKLSKHEVQNFKSWLHVMCKNHCLMLLRSQKKTHVSFEDIPGSGMENQFFLHHEEEVELETNLVKLEDCIEKLIGAQKECVKLFYLKKKCYREIEISTQFELKKIKSYIQNGKRNLKICMEENG